MFLGKTMYVFLYPISNFVMVPLPEALVLADTGKGGEIVVEVFENERWSPTSGWGTPTSYVTGKIHCIRILSFNTRSFSMAHQS